MRKILIALISVSFLFAMAAAQETSMAKNRDVQQTLMQMEQKWAEAAKAANPSAVSPMLSDNTVLLDSGGTIYSKAGELDRISKAKWQVNEISDMQVTQNGDTAVVTGTWRGKGVDGTGKNVDTNERLLDTWQRMPDGTWKCIASAFAPIIK